MSFHAENLLNFYLCYIYICWANQMFYLISRDINWMLGIRELLTPFEQEFIAKNSPAGVYNRWDNCCAPWKKWENDWNDPHKNQIKWKTHFNLLAGWLCIENRTTALNQTRNTLLSQTFLIMCNKSSALFFFFAF